jgi:hypothetical protein
MDIFNTEQFRTAVIIVSQRQHDWTPREFMSVLHVHILRSMKRGEVQDNVFVLYFTLLHRLTGSRSVTRTTILNTLNKINWI